MFGSSTFYSIYGFVGFFKYAPLSMRGASIFKFKVVLKVPPVDVLMIYLVSEIISFDIGF